MLVDDMIVFFADADGFALMVVKREMHALHERQIGRDIAVGDFDYAVFHVLRVDELDLIDHVQFLKDSRADKAIEIAARNEPVFP